MKRVVIVLKRVKLGYVIDNLHEKVHISVPCPPSELTKAAIHYPLILHLVNVAERFDGFCVSSSRSIH